MRSQLTVAATTATVSNDRDARMRTFLGHAPRPGNAEAPADRAGASRDLLGAQPIPRRRAVRAFWREERIRRSRLTSSGSCASAAEESMRVLSAW